MKLSEKLMKQLEEDRERVKALFDNVKGELTDPQAYMMLGDFVIKLNDLMTKQTSQLLDIYKTEEKNRKEDEDINFSREESEEIQDIIDSKNVLRFKDE